MFELISKDQNSQARAGKIMTDHGEILTPIFMPVGTQGTVKTIHQRELEEVISAQIILGNTYHLYLRPGTDLIESAGGLHSFMNWTNPLLTDSGGYQVYSLSQKRKIKEEGVVFQSHLDGSKHFLSPETATDIQRIIGADIIMAFDECTPYPCDYRYAKRSMHLTHRWLDRSLTHMEATHPKYDHRQVMAPIVQGSTYPDLRRMSAEYVSDKDCPINAIGGLSVGEPHEDMYTMTQTVCDILPKDKARYLMGVGTPMNILECISLGIDMFDCVLPSRNARHGLLYTAKGIINIKNAKWKNNLDSIDEELDCPTSNLHSKAYLRHLFVAKEYLGFQIATLHNLRFYLWLVEQARTHILDGTFTRWKNDMVKNMSRRL